ncbi:hypothetical protein Patl1_33061 [Pistacia atlantica]|uniref:Uncharacterized protein n=1 Tax=Pistacia atlantica TaxID=434234 RepID=A0ACC1ARN8_9ROSI|nr:hypothetical protein Patl1_33061 [Pistacia atlantica]
MEVENIKKSSVSDVGAWGMNIVSSVGLIMTNKQLMSPSGFGFGFATTLTGFHFTVTALVGLVSNAAGYSASKHVPFWELLWFSIVANMSITGMNFSLMLNSVGFYQNYDCDVDFEAEHDSVVCVMEWILHSKHYSKEVKMAVVSIGSLQKKYSIGSFELLSKTAPIQAISLVLAGPFIDYSLNDKFLFNYNLSYGALFFILLSCSLAVFCNVSQYLCIGRFSAELTLKNILGMSVAVVGMVVYSWAVEVEKKKVIDSKAISHVKNIVSEENLQLLKQSSGIESQVKDVELGKLRG